jgi:hypothetical protein
MDGQLSIFDFLQRETTEVKLWQCYYCKYINRDKKKITGVHRNIYYFGCRKSDSGYVVGGAAIGDEDTWLKRMGCGMFEMGRDT